MYVIGVCKREEKRNVAEVKFAEMFEHFLILLKPLHLRNPKLYGPWIK